MKKNGITKLKMFLSVLSGFLLTLSFPKTGAFWLSWFAVTPLLIASRNLSGASGYRLGFCCGLAHYLTLVYWLAYTMKTYGNLPMYLAVPVLFLLAAYLALYTAAFAFLFCRVCTTPLICLAAGPCLWVSLEYARSFLFTGFPWELVGYTQFQVLPLIQVADICGVYGVSYVVVLVNTALLLVFLFFANDDWQGKKIPRRFAAGTAGALALVFGLVWGYGERRLGVIEEVASNSPSVTIAVVQGNIDQTIKWNRDFQRSSIRKHIELSGRAKDRNPDLVVWPETAAPFYFLHNTRMSNLVLEGIRDVGADFLIGSPSFRSGANGVEYYNSAYLIDSKQRVMGRYDKAHLVPFGEYIPFKKWLPFLGKMVENVGDFSPGKKGRTLAWREFDLGVQICYEIIFPDLSRRMADAGAQLLVNLTNDAWYGRTSAPFQHFSMATFRAVENRRSLVRSANTGISGFVDPAGRVVAATGLFEARTVTREVPLLREKTFYCLYGDVFAKACLGISLAAALLGFVGSGLVRHKP